MNDKERQKLIIQGLKNQKILNSIATQMAFPLLRRTNYTSLGKKLLPVDEIPPNLYYSYAIAVQQENQLGQFHMKLPYKRKRKSLLCILQKKHDHDYANPKNDPIFEIHSPYYSWYVNLSIRKIYRYPDHETKEDKSPRLPASMQRKMIRHILDILRNPDKYNSEEKTR